MAQVSAVSAAQDKTGSGGVVQIQNPLDGKVGSTMTLQTFIGQLIKGALSIIGSLALIMFTYGGFVWMFSRGDSKKVQEGKDIFLWASIGLAIVFSSYTLAKFVFTSLGV